MKKLILLAGGIGPRTGLKIPKQYLQVDDKRIIDHLIERIEGHFDHIYLVANSPEIKENKKITIVEGGRDRFFSTRNGLIAADIQEGDIIHIHDAARPLITKEEFSKNENLVSKENAVISVAPSYDTMFVIDENSLIKEVYEKSRIVRGMTPQTYLGSHILNQWNEIKNNDVEIDLTSLLKIKFKTSEAISNLRKVTDKNDVEWIKGAL